MSESSPTPLVWAESTDECENSRFEALSHLYADASGTFNAGWRAYPILRQNRCVWRVCFRHSIETESRPEILTLTAALFESAAEAKDAAERVEAELGGAELAPRTPTEDPDQAPPATVDEHGYAPTRTIRSRWSRNEGRLYFSRVWAKPENPEYTTEKALVGEEYEAALKPYITQRMVEALVGSITQPGGWIVPLVWRTSALGEVRLECEVHFAAVRGLVWSQFPVEPTPEWQQLPTPSHALICSIVGERLHRQQQEFDAKMAGTTEDQLRRDIARNARKLGIASPIPDVEQETGHVLPMTLENMAAEGVDLRGNDLRQ